MSDAVYFASAAEFTDWLAAHHDTATELWVGYHKKGTGRPSMTWQESVKAALCYGWIDGLRRSVDAERYRIRFTPRRPGSIWSGINIRLVEELTAAGLMKPAGLAAFARRDEAKSRVYSFEREQAELTPAFRRRFRSDTAAWSFFEKQPPSYRKAALGWVMSARREETRARRLKTLIADSAAGLRIRQMRR